MILLTGATGFIGSHLLDRLRAQGAGVRCLVRGRRELPVETALADLATGQGLDAALDGIDTVLHLAGVTKALRPGDYDAGNVVAAGNLARAAAGRVRRFVHVSSLAAVGPAADTAPVDENTVPHPVSLYGRSKLAGEAAVRRFLPDAVVVRPPVVYGPRDTDVFQLLKAVSQGLVVEISGGERWFSAIYVADLVEGILAAARSPQAAGRDYFLSFPKASTWSELGGFAAAIMGKRPRILRVSVGAAYAVGFCGELWSRGTGNAGIVSRDKIREARYRYWICSAARAAADLGFTASTSLETGLAATLTWYKEAGWLKY